MYALELKSYRDEPAFRQSITQAAAYGNSLGLDRIYLVVFVEYIPEGYREKYEAVQVDRKLGITVAPVIVGTGK